jgi:hypothetical protein
LAVEIVHGLDGGVLPSSKATVRASLCAQHTHAARTRHDGMTAQNNQARFHPQATALIFSGVIQK